MRRVRLLAWGVGFGLVLGAVTGVPALAQSPNTSSVVVTVSDQSGALVPDAHVSVVNTMTGAARESASGLDGTATMTALGLTGNYRVTVSKPGFSDQAVDGLELRAGETATVRVKLIASGGSSEVTVYGTTQGIRADPQIGRRIEGARIDETPILGRKLATLPLFNSSFRQAKGTGDVYINAPFYVTAAGGRRQTTVILDGASNDESWGRQSMLATVPLGAVQEIAALTNAFSAEFGWTSGPALNIVTKSGTNTPHGELLYLNRPGGAQAKTFGTDGFCAPSVATCQTPSTLVAINPADVPDVLNQFSASFGMPLAKDRTFLFAAGDYAAQDRTAFISSSLPAFVLPADGNLAFVGQYRQALFNGRVDHKLDANQTLTARVNVDHFYDTNPGDAVGGTSAPSVARKYSRGSWAAQANHTAVISASLLNEARVAYLNGDPVNHWEAATLSTTYTRSGSVPFTVGQSRVSDMYSRQIQLSDTLSWSRGRHYVRFGGSVSRHTSGGAGSEPGTAVLGTFTFKSTTTAPLDQLALNDVQQYTQPISYGITRYDLSQWLVVGFVQDKFRVGNDLTLDLGVRYDRQTLTDAKANLSPRVGFGWNPNGDSRLAVRGGYGIYYTQVRSNLLGSALTGGLEGLATYTATPGQVGFPTCLQGSCLPVPLDPKTTPASQLPARDITVRAGDRAYYQAQFAKYGLNFDLLPYYPDDFRNPRSQVATVGAEREVAKGLFVSADYVHQHWTDLDRTVDLNAPSLFERTAVGQTRTVAAANATRPIVPVNGGIRQVNVLTNLGIADYDGLQTQVTYRGHSGIYAAVSYTLSKSTNTSEPDGNGVGPNQSVLAALGEVERGPSLLDQRHRAVVTFSYQLPFGLAAGTVCQFASARPFTAVTGVDNNGDGLNNDRPVVNGMVIGKSAFRGTGTQDVSAYVEEKVKVGRGAVLLRVEVFNLTNHANILGRAQTTYGDTATVNSTFGQVASVGTAANALPALANIDPSRMIQFQLRYQF